MKIIDVRENISSDVGFSFDDTQDYVFMTNNYVIQFHRSENDLEISLCRSEIEQIINFFKAVKAASGITETITI